VASAVAKALVLPDLVRTNRARFGLGQTSQVGHRPQFTFVRIVGDVELRGAGGCCAGKQ